MLYYSLANHQPIQSRQLYVAPRVAIINRSTAVTDEQSLQATRALQIQVDRDVGPHYYTGANLIHVGKNETIPEQIWELYILDTTDQAGALGYHTSTTDGKPIGKVFALDSQRYNLNWTVTLSHELLEMLMDPYVNITVFAQTGSTSGYLYAYEVCDPVEDDSMGYWIEGVKVSNFVTPLWFQPWRQPGSGLFDYQNITTKPFEVAPRGYIPRFKINSGVGWTNFINAQSGPGDRLLFKNDLHILGRTAIRDDPGEYVAEEECGCGVDYCPSYTGQDHVDH